MNYPPFSNDYNDPNDPNDPHSQPTIAGQYPQWEQPEPTTAGQYPQSGQNFPSYPQQYSQNEQWSQSGQPPYPQPMRDKIPLFDVKARKGDFKRNPEAQKKQFFIACGTLIGIFLLFALSSAIGNASKFTQRPAEALVSSLAATQAPTDTLEPTDTPEPTDDDTPDTDTLTPTPTPEPTQSPVQQSVQQPAAQLFVTITSAYATDSSSDSVSVHTLPGAALTISVTYCSGRSATSESLQGTKYADSAGNYTWTWEPETKCKGTATAYVSASLNGQSANDSKDFTVS